MIIPLKDSLSWVLVSDVNVIDCSFSDDSKLVGSDPLPEHNWLWDITLLQFAL